MFKCCDCSYETKYKTSFDAHCAKHKNIKLFKCDDCDFESNYKRHLVSHKLNHCPKKNELNSNKNSVVNQSKNSQSLSLSEIMLFIFNKRNSLDENVSVSSPTEPLKCSECSFVTENQTYLEFHSQIHSEVQKCPECGYESTDIETFIKHLIKAHLDQSTIESESASSFRKRSKQSNKTVVDDPYDEEHIEISGKQKHENSEDELMDVAEENKLDSDKRHRKRWFKCPDCSYVSCNSTNFVFHCLNHTKNKLFQCEHCSFKTNYRRTIKKHNLNCIKNQENSPSDCLNKAVDENVDYHSLSLSEIINLICNQDKSLDYNTSDEATTEVLKCLECTFGTGNQKIFNLHSQIHVEVKKCTECNFESKNTETFKDHLIGHFKHKNIEKQKMFECCDCSYKTKYKTSFDAHCAKHKNIKLFKCDDCDFVSNYKRHLVSHKLNLCPKNAELNSNENCVVNQSKNLQYFSLSLSEILLLIYNKRNLLDENASVPSPTEPLKCPQCSFESENQKYLEVHSQIHCEVQKCPECNYETTDTETFKDHLIKTHLNESNNDRHRIKKYKCPDCRYTSLNYESFVVHCLDHVNDKLFQCENCDFKTNYKTSMKNHVLKCLKSPNKSHRKCYSISNNKENINYHLLSLSEIMNLVCKKTNSLDLNISDEATKEEVLKCLECTFETGNLKLFNLHLQIHVEVKKCTECSFEINCLEKFKNHLITHLDCCGNKSDSPSHSCRNSKLSVSGIYEDVFRGNTDKNMKWEVQECLNRIKTRNKTKSQRKDYACDKCSYKADSYADFLSHKLVHNNENSDCVDITTHLDNLKDYSFSDIISMICDSENEVNQDKNLNSEAKLHKCSQCSFECSDEVQLSEHLSSHSTEQKFICSQCCFEGSNQSDLDSHLQTHSTFKCSKCSYECSDIDELNLHSCKCNSERVFKCSDCDFETKKEKHLTLHSQLHAKLRRCTECSYSHHSKDKFKEHLKSHFPTKLYTCTKCSYKTNFIKKLKVHLFNHTNIRVFTCPQCDYKTNHKGNMKNHLDTHIEVKTYRCSECDYSTPTSASLKEHVLNHSQIKQFLCGECDYGCNSKARMKEHVKQHSNERPYKCSQCDFSTKYEKNFIQHKAKHTGQFSYSCSQCDYKCIYKQLLKQHSLNTQNQIIQMPRM
ncbi:hypothetical protein Avbf_14560 [Armadillidium vulgare]|nr:hypothetical protein Avbf_14560 [Armadillidium vulgare]